MIPLPKALMQSIDQVTDKEGTNYPDKEAHIETLPLSRRKTVSSDIHCDKTAEQTCPSTKSEAFGDVSDSTSEQDTGRLSAFEMLKDTSIDTQNVQELVIMLDLELLLAMERCHTSEDDDAELRSICNDSISIHRERIGSQGMS